MEAELTRRLDGKRIMIVEDEFLPALDLQQMIEDWGGIVVGPVGRLDQARKLAASEELDGAILDVKLDRETSFPVAEDLLEKNVPVILATGYDAATLPSRFVGLPRLTKPYHVTTGERTILETFALG